ncbi:MAG: hypothetical protein QNI90_18710 [Dinoroseobacter sp.]|nr:hypothetical protein [Dinoroseobacter sp.]MDJ0995618.1 hypothetical protein [Dinoroseobacter sp.]
MKQAQFITLMSESLGVEEKTIRVIVRTLREAGLFTTGARGVNAPDITPLDAVRVVIAVVASTAPSRAVRDVLYFGSLKPDRREERTDYTKALGLDPDKTLEETLLDCMEDRFPDDAIIGGYIHLTDRGDAHIHIAHGWQGYHQREQWQSINDGFASYDRSRRKAAIEASEAIDRIWNTKVNRSAEFPLEGLCQIGSEMIGWEVG